MIDNLKHDLSQNILDEPGYFKNCMAIIGTHFVAKAQDWLQPDYYLYETNPVKFAINKVIGKSNVKDYGWQVLNYDYEKGSHCSLYIMRDGSMLEVLYKESFGADGNAVIEYPVKGCTKCFYSREATDQFINNIIDSIEGKIFPETLF